jgi:hypothetical protein
LRRVAIRKGIPIAFSLARGVRPADAPLFLRADKPQRPLTQFPECAVAALLVQRLYVQ